MRKLSHNEILELRACKNMDNGRSEFFVRCKDFYKDDAEATERISKLEDLYENVSEIPSTNTSAYGAYMKSLEMYYKQMDEFLAEVGYTASDEAD